MVAHHSCTVQRKANSDVKDVSFFIRALIRTFSSLPGASFLAFITLKRAISVLHTIQTPSLFTKKKNHLLSILIICSLKMEAEFFFEMSETFYLLHSIRPPPKEKYINCHENLKSLHSMYVYVCWYLTVHTFFAVFFLFILELFLRKYLHSWMTKNCSISSSELWTAGTVTFRSHFMHLFFLLHEQKLEHLWSCMFSAISKTYCFLILYLNSHSLHRYPVTCSSDFPPLACCAKIEYLCFKAVTEHSPFLLYLSLVMSSLVEVCKYSQLLCRSAIWLEFVSHRMSCNTERSLVWYHYFECAWLNVMAEWLAALLCIHEILG